MRLLFAAALLTGLALGNTGCDDGLVFTSMAPWIDGDGESVGAEGGTIILQGRTGYSGLPTGRSSLAEPPPAPTLIKLEIPPGALDEPVEIGVTYRRRYYVESPRREVIMNMSPMFQFAPEGLTFNVPVTVRIRVGDTWSLDPVLYWSLPGDLSTFAPLKGAEIAGGTAVAEITHFSRAFVGAPCRPECSGRECGHDGCGGVCGTCESDERCSEGVCRERNFRPSETTGETYTSDR